MFRNAFIILYADVNFKGNDFVGIFQLLTKICLNFSFSIKLIMLQIIQTFFSVTGNLLIVINS